MGRPRIVALGLGAAVVLSAASALAAAAAAAASPTPAAGLNEGQQYAAFAAAVNLRSADLPGFAASAPSRSGGGGNGGGGTCGVSALGGHRIADFQSDRFKSGDASRNDDASSEVEIESGPGVARQAVQAFQRALRSKATRQCLTRDIGGSIERSLLNVSAGHNGELQVLSSQVRLGAPNNSPPPEGVEASGELSLAVRVEIRIAAHDREVRLPLSLYMEVQLLALGRALVSLTVFSIDQAFPSSLENRLYALVVSRATTAAPEYPALAH